MFSFTTTVTDQDYYGKQLPTTKETFSGDTEDEAFAAYFKKTNSLKYTRCRHVIDNPTISNRYWKVWFTTNNYAKHGGDMW